MWKTFMTKAVTRVPVQPIPVGAPPPQPLAPPLAQPAVIAASAPSQPAQASQPTVPN
jgi:hypothetical protein